MRTGINRVSARHAQPTRAVDTPQPGYFRLRRRGYPDRPAAIIHAPSNDPVTGQPLDRSYWWAALIDGLPVGEPSPAPGTEVMSIWHYGEPISAEEYTFMVADAEWCRAHAPAEPRANPRQRVDLRSMPVPFSEGT